MTQLKRAALLVVAVCLTSGLVGQSPLAHGQVGIGFGGYYGGYGTGYGWGSGYGYNAPLWYNRNGYYSPPIYPSYVRPQYMVSPIPMAPITNAGQIVLFVPADASSGIQYTLNGQPYALKPGESQVFANDRQWTIEFPATSDGQIALRYSLTSATYKFKPSGTGMGLFQTQDQPPATGPLPAAPTPVPNPPSAN